jgi:hypothetical protein
MLRDEPRRRKMRLTIGIILALVLCTVGLAYADEYWALPGSDTQDIYMGCGFSPCDEHSGWVELNDGESWKKVGEWQDMVMITVGEVTLIGLPVENNSMFIYDVEGNLLGILTR